MKPGKQTTEWLTMLGVIILIALPRVGVTEPQEQQILQDAILGAVSGIYTIARTILKKVQGGDP